MNNKKLIASLVLSCVLTTGCFSTKSWPLEQRPDNWGQALQLSDNFYQISTDIFRSEQPNTEMASSLKAHDIGVVINLRSRHQDPQNLDAQNFELVHIPIHTWAINREDLLAVMRQIQLAKAQQQKVLIHCYHGSDRTGASIAMYRIVFEQWSIDDALQEMKYGGYGFHPIWQNIENLFTPENVKWIQEQLSNPS